MKGLSYLLCSLLALANAGCLYIPTPQHNLLAGRGMIDADMTQGFRNGLTVREDILLSLGEPDATLNNQSIFLYTWTRTQGYLIVGGPNRGSADAVGETTVLLFEFDADNRLKRFERTTAGLFSTPLGKAQRWSQQGETQAGSAD